ALTARTLSELGTAIRARLRELAPRIAGFMLADDFEDGLVAQVTRFNQQARVGVDEDHHRGEAPIELAWASEPREPGQANPTMYPFADEGPYHCIILAGGALDTKGG